MKTSVHARVAGMQYHGFTSCDALKLFRMEHALKQFQRSGLVPPFLDENVQHLTFLVDGAPHEHANSVDPHGHFIEIPDAVGTSALAANVGSDRRAELIGPTANGLLADIDAAFGEHLLNIAQVRGKTEVEPYCESDCVRRL